MTETEIDKLMDKALECITGCHTEEQLRVATSYADLVAMKIPAGNPRKLHLLHLALGFTLGKITYSKLEEG